MRQKENCSGQRLPRYGGLEPFTALPDLELKCRSSGKVSCHFSDEQLPDASPVHRIRAPRCTQKPTTAPDLVVVVLQKSVLDMALIDGAGKVNSISGAGFLRRRGGSAWRICRRRQLEVEGERGELRKGDFLEREMLF